jgi:glycine/D-amino acid oxidase-like deaminating enzyme/nitrite reductase/ring-hydroxylating ferredoxin subunit
MHHWGTSSVWTTDAPLPTFPTLDRLDHVDVIIVGGGIAGLTTGLLLQRAGYRTAVLEQHTFGSGETSRTSAHLTVYPDMGFARIAADFGPDAATAIATAQQDALRLIGTVAADVDCDFERVSGFLYTEDERSRDQLSAELNAAIAAGCTARPLDRAPLPFPTAGAIEFPDQAQFHPVKYLAGLIRMYADAGGCVSEHTHVRAVDEEADRCRVRTERTVFNADWVVALSDAPITGGGLLDTKLRANRSYVLLAHVAPREVPTGLFWDTEEPYHYIRAARLGDGVEVIIGGEDHRTGTNGEVQSCELLERYARQRFSDVDVRSCWSGQIMEPVDGLPYIGRRDTASRVLLASGFAGNGLTFGTVAAQLLTDVVRGTANPYADLFSPHRLMGAKQWAKYAAQNLPAAWTLVSDMLPHPRAATLDDLAAGDGRVVTINGRKVGAARAADGTLHLVSPTCTHMGCDVAWNNLEQTWDCPCHGSRYDLDGEVIHGPAMEPLETLAAPTGPAQKPRSGR